MLKQEIISMVEQLPHAQLQEVSDYIKTFFTKEEEFILNDEQKELLDLLNYTIDSGRGDFSENHDHYIYKIE